MNTSKGKVSSSPKHAFDEPAVFELGDEVQWVNGDGSIEPGIGVVVAIENDGHLDFYTVEYYDGGMDEASGYGLIHADKKAKKLQANIVQEYLEWARQGGENPLDGATLDAFNGDDQITQDEYNDIYDFIEEAGGFVAKLVASYSENKKGKNMGRKRFLAEDNARNDQGDNEGEFISETPPAEPVADPSDGGDAPNQTPEQRVDREDPDNNQLAVALKAVKNLEAQITKMAEEIGENRSDEGGGDTEREDLYEEYGETQPKDAKKSYQARRHEDFIKWVKATKKVANLKEASSPAELRSWARTYAKLAEIEVSELHELLSKVISEKRAELKAAATKTAEDDSDDSSNDDSSDEDSDDDDSKESSVKTASDDEDGSDDEDDSSDDDSDDENKKESRRHEPRRRSARRRQGAPRRQARRRKEADVPQDSKDESAPDDRMNVEKPTAPGEGDEGEESQFSTSDFGNNAGDDIADPDMSTDHQWLPGEGKKSNRQSPKGHETVRLAEAYVSAGLAEKDERWKLATQFEKMDRSIVLDRTALLEAVATKAAANTKKTAGTLGASMKSAVPKNLGNGGAGRTASVEDSDTDFFLMK